MNNKNAQEEKKSNNSRYHQLLNYFYGAPTDFSAKNKRHAKSR